MRRLSPFLILLLSCGPTDTARLYKTTPKAPSLDAAARKALLEKFPRGRGRTMTAEESADELLALVGWARADIDRIIALKKVVADRSTLRRKRARAVAATFYELRRDSKND